MEHRLEAYQEGKILLINKPLEWTSFQAVNRIKKNLKHAFKIKKIKVGHAGTLDPLATGLLLICTGKFTKRISELQGQEKEYTGIIKLGATTPSYDLETAINETFAIDHINEDLLKEAVGQLTGDIEQTPPVFSALRVDGERLYKKARRGEEIEIKKRQVHVSSFDAILKGDEVRFRISCSKGTYIRSIAHDLGKLLHSGAHLVQLCRTRIGDYQLEDALDLNGFVDNLWLSVRNENPEG